MIAPEFCSRYQDALPADPETRNIPRQVENACYSWVTPKTFRAPTLLALSEELAGDLGLDMAFCRSSAFAEAFVGNRQLAGMRPYACCYGGHQFGNWAGQLGDGRAINLGELPDAKGQLMLYQLKGAGPTPYSRFADGLAVLRSSIREFLCSEAMHHLGVPTTRALALIRTGESVERDMFYDGNPEMEPGAVVTRIAPSFTRFGNFEIFAARADHATLERLVAYTIQYDFPHLYAEYQKDKIAATIQWLAEVAERTCDMIVHWMRVGFVHGVMNTDNMSILGLTIDYGPYGWLENYDPDWTPNTTDLEFRRYRFQNQPAIAQWNLLQLANALYPLIKSTAELEHIVSDFGPQYERKWQRMMSNKLGLIQCADSAMLDQLERLMKRSQIDLTLFFNLLGDANNRDLSDFLRNSSYKEAFSTDELLTWRNWFERYNELIAIQGGENTTRCELMRKNNPVFILRNYVVQMAIERAHEGDDSRVLELLQALRHPYSDHPSHQQYRAKRPAWAVNKPGCSILSCSS